MTCQGGAAAPSAPPGYALDFGIISSELIKYVVLSWAKVLKWFRMKRTNGTTKMREENKELYGRIDRGKETSYSLNGVLRQRPKLDGGLSI